MCQLNMLFLNFLFILTVNKCLVQSNIIRYHEELPEGSVCALGNGSNGECQNISNCLEYFQRNQKNKEKTSICSFGKNHFDTVICCPAITSKQTGFVDLSFENCRDQYLQYRTSYPENVHSAVNGLNVMLGEFSNIAAIGWTDDDDDGTTDYHCGGTIITSRHVLTCAHCTRYLREAPDVVRLGDIDLKSNEDDQNVQLIKIEKIYRHKEYKFSAHYHDIALIKVVSDIVFNKNIAPACIWSLGIEGYGLKAAGYGAIGFGDRRSDKLLKVYLEIVDNANCSYHFQGDSRLLKEITEEQFCAKSAASNDLEMDTCSGDSGGPLQTPYSYLKDGLFYDIPILIGLTSFGIGCASGSPAVYVNTTSYIDWIKFAINELS